MPWGRRLGGAEALLQSVLDGSRETEHQIELVFFEQGPWVDELREAGFRVEVIPAGRMRQAHRSVSTVLALAKLFRARRPDLILNWSAKTQLYGSAAAIVARMTDRVVWWQHGIPAPIPWLDRCATLLPARAIGCCSQAAARAQARLSPRRATFVVAPGTAAPQARSERATRGSEPPVVGLVGRLQPWKGQDRLLNAQALLRGRGHSMRSLVVGGDAYGLSPEYARSLPPLIRSLGLTDAVTMTGQVADVGPYIDQMDILVNASDPEPFGIVLLEGMARGVAVVAVDSGGPREFIDDGRTGVLARSGTPEALADALEPLLVSPDLRSAIAHAGHERFCGEFTDVALRGRFFQSLEAVAAGREAASR